MNLQGLREIAKIRDRGQLTIPYKIREILTWLETDSVIEIIPKKTDRVELKPLISWRRKKAKNQKEIDALWRKMRTAGRLGRQIQLAEFVIKDRERR